MKRSSQSLQHAPNFHNNPFRDSVCLIGVGICGWLFDLYELALVFSILQNGNGLLNCVILNNNGEDLEKKIDP